MSRLGVQSSTDFPMDAASSILSKNSEANASSLLEIVLDISTTDYAGGTWFK